jgi:hypothetical protein
MALPIAAAADLAKDMASKGIAGSISMGEPKEEDDDAKDADEQIKPVLDDIDAMVPGLGKLMLELCDKLLSMDKEQDAQDLE